MFAGTWVGTNFKGEECSLTFGGEGHATSGFTFKSPGQTLQGDGWFLTGQPDYDNYHQRDLWSYKFVVEFKTNYARLSGEMIKQGDSLQMRFDDVAPLVLGIDYKALLGEAYKEHATLVEKFDCAGQEVGGSVIFDASSRRARQSFEDSVVYEQDLPRLSPGPYGLGEACYFKGSPVPGLVPELLFVRENVCFSFPASSVSTRNQEVCDQIYKVAYLLDSAVRDEHPAVTVVHMPKSLRKAP